MARRGVGSNQYKTRAGVEAQSPAADLIQQAAGQGIRCADVWGFARREVPRCQQLVYPPSFSHGNHGSEVSSVLDLPPRARQALASLQQCPTDTLEQLARDTDPDVRGIIIQNLRSTSAALDIIARSGSVDTRLAVAKHPNLGADTLAFLATDSSGSIRRRVAMHPHCPPQVLDRLAKDEEDLVRWQVTQNKQATADTLVGMLQDRHKTIRAGAALNPNLPEEYRTLHQVAQ